jgi:fructokinase
LTYKQPIVIGLGEVLWDMLPGGRQLGGAPANFAYHTKILGAEAYVVSSVGDDSLGRDILAQLDRLGLDRRCVAIDAVHATGTVSVELDVQGKPSYVIHENVAWDNIPLTPELVELCRRADILCFGSIAQRSEISRATIRACLAATGGQCLRIFDVNLRQHYYDAEVIRAGLQAARVLKLNDEELPVVATMLGISGSEAQMLHSLLGDFSLDLIALTRGEKGATLVTGNRSSAQSVATGKVVDTVGAGDAFTAALAIGLHRGLDLDVINRHACRLAAYVCTRPGATPEVPEELIKNYAIQDK